MCHSAWWITLLLHHRLTSLSYLTLPPSLLLQKGLAWPTAVAPSYIAMPTCGCRASAQRELAHPHIPVGIAKILSTLPSISASASSAVHTSLLRDKLTRSIAPSPPPWAKSSGLQHSPSRNWSLALYSEKDIFVLQRRAESVIIDVLQERQAGKMGHVEQFLFRLWRPDGSRDKGNDLPGTWQPLPFGKQPRVFCAAAVDLWLHLLPSPAKYQNFRLLPNSKGGQ